MRCLCILVVLSQFQTDAPPSTRPDDAVIAARKLGGAVSFVIQGNEKVVKLEFTNGDLSDSDLHCLIGLELPCILDL